MTSFSVRLRSFLLGGSCVFATFGLGACGGKADINYVGSGSGSCGNGTVEDGELCDDENAKDGDGCSAECQPEPGWVCGEDGCAQTCGNGKVDDGEACDDGEVKNGDGCTDTCQVEGSCQAPIVFELEAGSNGVPRDSIDSSTAGGGNQVDAADCDGDDVGSGADRVFELNLETTSIVTVKVEGSFNMVVRLLDEPCKINEGASCANSGGAGAAETLSAVLPAGKHFILVDGTNEKAVGDFTISVTAECPPDSIQLDQINYNAGYTQIAVRNTSPTCTVNLARVGLTTLNSSSRVDHELPSALLGPDQTVIFTGNIPAGYDDIMVELEDAPIAYPSAGAIALCRGKCDLSDSSNLLDYYAMAAPGWESELPAPPEGAQFAPAPISVQSYTRYYSSYLYMQRVAHNSVAPVFLRSDWRPVLYVDPNRNPLDTNYNPFTVATGSAPTVVEDDDGSRVLNVAADSQLNLALPAELLNAKNYSASVRCLDGIPSDNGCGLFHLGLAASGTWVFLNFGLDDGVAPAWNLNYVAQGAAEADTWHDMDFVFGTDTATFDAVLDGEAAADVAYYNAGTARERIQIGNWTTVSGSQYRHILVY